ncbi:glutaredoxin 2 [Photobacterium angustum]|uniref:Glutaredoxin, GrxB family n=1 Tax=Photobacterium angustum TaxID=661 RepID=A0A2S7VVV7_PHOAN|nr:glutaredoxin 2 [Photobacterium angustum]PQJ66246.1 glutaredoxin, GrxB family [Photobacterium angustum]
MKLFVFDHCPFCVKAMMIAGLKKADIELVYLQNHDIDARIEKVGANMVPILQKPDGSYMAESLDVVKFIDNNDGCPVLAPEVHQDELVQWTEAARDCVPYLLYPRWLKVDLPEFQVEEAKTWFYNKKTPMLSVSFEQAFENSSHYIELTNKALQTLEWVTLPSERSNQLSYDDIHLFPMLRNLTVVKGIQYPTRVRQYIDEVAALTSVPLYDDVAV